MPYRLGSLRVTVCYVDEAKPTATHRRRPPVSPVVFGGATAVLALASAGVLWSTRVPPEQRRAHQPGITLIVTSGKVLEPRLDIAIQPQPSSCTPPATKTPGHANPLPTNVGENAASPVTRWETTNQSPGGFAWGGTDDRLHVHGLDGAELWTFEDTQDVTAQPLVVGNRIYAAGESGVVRAFELNGDMLWETDVTGPVRAPLVQAGEDMIWVLTSGLTPQLIRLGFNGTLHAVHHLPRSDDPATTYPHAPVVTDNNWTWLTDHLCRLLALDTQGRLRVQRVLSQP